MNYHKRYIPHVDHIRRSHPLANGLAGLWLLNQPGGLNVRDLSENQLDGILNSPNGNLPSWGQGALGGELPLNNVLWHRQTVRVPRSPVKGEQDRTVVMLIKPTNVGGQILAEWGELSGTGKKWTLRFNAGKLSVELGNYNGVSDLEVNAGEWGVVGCRATGSQQRLFVNGEEETLVMIPMDTGEGLFGIGGSTETLGSYSYFTGSIGFVAIWNRYLSDDEMYGILERLHELISPESESWLYGRHQSQRGWRIYGGPGCVTDLNLNSPLTTVSIEERELELSGDMLPSNGERWIYLVRESDAAGNEETSAQLLQLRNDDDVIREDVQLPVWPSGNAWAVYQSDNVAVIRVIWAEPSGRLGVKKVQLETEDEGQVVTTTQQVDVDSRTWRVEFQESIPESVAVRFRLIITYNSGVVITGNWSQWVNRVASQSHLLETI